MNKSFLEAVYNILFAFSVSVKDNFLLNIFKHFCEKTNSINSRGLCQSIYSNKNNGIRAKSGNGTVG
jgi:hypothetical protein